MILLLFGEFFFGLDARIAANMNDADALVAKNAPDQEPPMAVRRIFLAAEQGDPARSNAIEKPGDALLESGRLCEAVVEDMFVVVVELLALRPPAKDIAQKQIPDPPRLQGTLERLFVEVQGVA